MLEPRRSHYLRALDVDVYVPRFILPNAKASVFCHWDEEALAARASLPAPTSQLVDLVVAELKAPARVEVSLPTRAELRKVPIPAIRTAETSNIPRFAVSVICADSGVMVVDEAPPTGLSREDYLRFISNVLFALQGRSATCILDTFVWPMTKNPAIDQSKAAAHEAVAGYLLRHIESRSVHTLLLFGESAAVWAAPAFADKGAPVTVRSISAWRCLRDASNKAQLWQDLQVLAGRQL